MLSRGYEGGLSLDPAIKLSEVRLIKNRIKFLAAKATPTAVVKKLPPQPADLQRSHPTVYESVLGKSPPVASPLDSSKLAHLQSTIPMRSSNKAMGPRASLTATGSAPGPAAMDVNGMMQLVQMLMRRGPSMSAHRLGSVTDDEIPIQMLQRSSPSKSPQQQLALPDVVVEVPKGPAAEETPPKCTMKEASVDDATDMLVKALRDRTTTKSVTKVLKRPASNMSGELELPVSKGTISVERSRMQVLARTGKKGKGQSKSFKYKAEGDIAAKKKEAEVWLRALGVEF
jgi:hypothetical protein